MNKELIDRFAADLAAAIEPAIAAQVQARVENLLGHIAIVGAKLHRVHKLPRACRVPGCKKPNKGPRFDFFCAEHRELPAKEKAKYKRHVS